MIYNYVIMNKLIQTDVFKSARNKRLFVMNTALDILHGEAHLLLESCENGHPQEKMKR